MQPLNYDYQKDAAEIYRESFAIIRGETDLDRFPDDVAHVVARMVHASAQPDIAGEIAWTPRIVSSCRTALERGAPILCDSTMVATGIIRSRLPADNEVICHLPDPALADFAKQRGTTKTAAAIEWWMERIDGAVVAIGNAPTALFRLLEWLSTTDARPAGVIGIPVGFVGAAESKQALIDNPLGLEYLVLKGRRGGSAVTVAAINAIASPAE